METGNEPAAAGKPSDDPRLAAGLHSDRQAADSVTESGGSSSDGSDSSPSAFRRDVGELQDDTLYGMSHEFTNWTFKNVELLGERNREMAEQAVELRGGGSSKDEPPP